MTGIKVQVTAYANIMAFNASGGYQIGHKNVIPLSSGVIELFVSDITSEKKIKNYSVAVGETPIITEIGIEPKNVRLTCLPNKCTSVMSSKTANPHSIQGIVNLIEELTLVRDLTLQADPNIGGASSNIKPIASVNNILIPGMIIKIIDATGYLHQLPLDSQWLVSGSGSTRQYGNNHTYLIYSFVLTRWS